MRGFVAAAVILLACGPSLGPDAGDEGEGSGSGAETGASSTVGSASATSASGSGETAGPESSGAASTSDETSSCRGDCFLDFPCNGGEPACVSGTEIESWSTIDCARSDECAGACFCSGAKCELTSTEPCPAETRCVETGSEHEPRAQCLALAEVCGGPEGISCVPEQMCELVAGACPSCPAEPRTCDDASIYGSCVERPPADDPCRGDLQPECGCDGVTYDNTCARRRLGVALAHLGAC